ncbi:MAG: M48 family metallopeptidase [Verrucomicrobiota bacterium]
MSGSSLVCVIALALILARWVAELWLERLNQRSALEHASAVPDAFKESIDPAAYARSVKYTLAKSQLSQIEETCDTIILVIALFSGILPWAFNFVVTRLGNSVPAMAGFLFVTGLVLALPGLPFAWYSQFRLEERFGFNTTTPKLWLIDRLKGLLLAMVLGYPLLILIVKLVEWTGARWWLWAWGSLLGFQLLLMVFAPILIMPWFNKFTPLPEGVLRERLLALAQRTGFQARSIQVMDGSKRSRHSNAFFTGFGRFRRIVLFDTLIQQLTAAELEAVLAHEIGHYKKRHIPKMLAASAASSLVAFYALSELAKQDWFYRAFGFEPVNIVPAFILFALVSGVFSFWFSPLWNLWSRRYEYQADKFAAETMREIISLEAALRKLITKNLSNLTPHPFYSGFYYSHPTLMEREEALARLSL